MKNVYLSDFDDQCKDNMRCLVAMNAKVNDVGWVRHNRLSHASMGLIAD